MTLLGSFDFTSWYAYVVYIAAAYVFWTTVFETGHRHVRWVWRRFHPPKPVPPDEPPVVLGHPSAHISLTPAHELAEGEYRKLVRVAPEYLIENQDPSVPIRDVTTGVRTRDGRSHTFEAFKAPMLGAGRDAWVRNVEIPPGFLEGVHESVAQEGFLYWARFTRQGLRWEVVYDPQTRDTSYMLNPEETAP